MHTAMSRRSLLTRGVLLGATTWITTAACSAPAKRPADPATSQQRAEPGGGSRVLLVYFSRAGENYYNGGRRNLKVGNTEVLAGMISDRVDCDVHRIEAADPYPSGYDATVARNVKEQNADARPAIANPLASIADYDTVLLGSPIWNVRTPMIMSTFIDGHDFTGKTILPFVTYAVSGLTGVDRAYAVTCPTARIGPGLAVRGEDVARHQPQVDAWLRRTGLLTN